MKENEEFEKYKKRVDTFMRRQIIIEGKLRKEISTNKRALKRLQAEVATLKRTLDKKS